jgi:hypothetical protein
MLVPEENFICLLFEEIAIYPFAFLGKRMQGLKSF